MQQQLSSPKVNTPSTSQTTVHALRKTTVCRYSKKVPVKQSRRAAKIFAKSQDKYTFIFICYFYLYLPSTPIVVSQRLRTKKTRRQQQQLAASSSSDVSSSDERPQQQADQNNSRQQSMYALAH